ncbi:response regulator transcription factor [Sorangium sp. So ce385]|uniref:helix-turn-helix transcriptional regulator n=1 Tax=Sorangium sp. So ce385 TaxID=3133308 RepID=UPI003F5BFE93
MRQLIRLIAEAQEIPANHPERQKHLISGLLRILGAVVGGSVVDCDFRPGGRGAFTAIVLEGWDSTTLPALEVLAQSGSAFNPGLRELMRVSPARISATTTAMRQELIDDRLWYGSPYVEHHLGPAHLDHALYSTRRGATPSVVHGLGMYRAKNERPFDEEDRSLLHLFHLECESMLRAPTPMIDDVLRAQLPRRERQTLDLLLGGRTDKEIAERLGISRYTVNQYTKSIYRRFGVGSRSMLLARLLGRGSTGNLQRTL